MTRSFVLIATTLLLSSTMMSPRLPWVTALNTRSGRTIKASGGRTAVEGSKARSNTDNDRETTFEAEEFATAFTGPNTTSEKDADIGDAIASDDYAAKAFSGPQSVTTMTGPYGVKVAQPFPRQAMDSYPTVIPSFTANTPYVIMVGFIVVMATLMGGALIVVLCIGQQPDPLSPRRKERKA